MTKAVNEREIVLAILMEVTENGQYSHIVLRDVLSKYQYLEKRERAFITRVTEGTLEHMIEIDYILNRFSKVKVKKMKPVIRNILRSAVSDPLHGPDSGQGGLQRVGETGGAQRFFRTERICKRSAAQYYQRNG